MSTIEWEEKFSEKHQKKFWKNVSTGEMVWKNPIVSSQDKNDVKKEALDSNAAVIDISTWEWEEKFSEKHQKKFWKNKSSGEMVWKEPPKPVPAPIVSSTVTQPPDNITSTLIDWEWEEKFNEKHKRKYWKHKTSGEIVWKEPPKPAAENTTAAVAGSTVASAVVEWEWEEKFNEKHKRKYWKHKTSGEIVWKEPPKPATEVIATPSAAVTAPIISKPKITHECFSCLIQWNSNNIIAASLVVIAESSIVGTFARLEIGSFIEDDLPSVEMLIECLDASSLSSITSNSLSPQKVVIKLKAVVKIAIFRFSEVLIFRLCYF